MTQWCRCHDASVTPDRDLNLAGSRSPYGQSFSVVFKAGLNLIENIYAIDGVNGPTPAQDVAGRRRSVAHSRYDCRPVVRLNLMPVAVTSGDAATRCGNATADDLCHTRTMSVLFAPFTPTGSRAD